MAYKLHRVFAFLSFFIIVLFFSSTLVVEFFFGFEEIAFIKNKIVCPGLFILIPSIAITAITGNIIARKSKKLELINVKKRRMPFIAFNGIAILIPCAIYLNILASNGIFDRSFYLVQGLELIVGAINLVLMFKNIRDSKKSI